MTDEFATQLDTYRDLLDGVQAIIWRADAITFEFNFVSAYAEALLGYPLQQWREPGFWSSHIHPDDREWAVALCANATKEKRRHELEYRMLAADGRAIWLLDVVHVVVENDHPKELVGVMMDITEKKEARQALEQSEDRLRQVIDTIPVQIWSGPADGTLDFCNYRWRFELGMTLEEIQGDGWRRMIHPDDQERVGEAWRESVATGMPYEQVERHCMATGEYRWFLCRATPLREGNGDIVRWFGCNTDIQLQKYAEEALRTSEQRWRGVFDNSKVGVALQDATLRYVDANAAFVRMVGYSVHELRSLTCLDITYEEDRKAFKHCIDDLLGGKLEHFELEKRYIRKDGKLLWARLNGSIVDSAGSKLWVVMAEDISGRKRLSDQLRRERDRLRLLLDLSNAFASKLEIHDFFSALSSSLRNIDGWDYSAILLPDAQDKHLQFYLWGEGPDRSGVSIPIEGRISGDAYRTGKAIVFRFEDLPPVSKDHQNSLLWREIAKTEGLDVGCAVPLLHDGRVLGILALATRNDVESARAALPFLQELAKLVAIALFNALRYGELSESHAKLFLEKSYIEEQIREEFGLKSIVGKSAALRGVLRQVHAVAPTDTTVLVLGETGTGKELIARAIHDRSPRCERSFIKVDCAAIPASLIESELFGHEKGAFTGATAQKLGRFEVADHGTIFLDEVGDVPLELQTKLLRVLQDHSFERLGSNKTRTVDVRVIAATHRDLEAMVQAGTFREDLYYRLKVFPIVIPPLRERTEDIPALVNHYVETYARRMKKPIPVVPQRVMDVFLRYAWPGNVRELQHFIERSVVLSSGRQLQAPVAELARIGRRKVSKPAPSGKTFEEIEREAILQALEDSKWMIGGPDGAAARLGLKRTTLASRMERLGISRQSKQ